MASLRPVWSKPAAYRALRATLVVPGMFAITDRVIGDLQMATFAAFGGFATLVLASFGGSRRTRLIAHFWLGVVGSALLVVGTAVTSTTALAVVVTVPLVFVVLFGGITSPNAASGGTAALLAYVLPAASAGAVSMIPSRLEGWWLATAAGTISVLILSPKPAADRLTAVAADCAAALGDALRAALDGRATAEDVDRSVAAKRDLMTAFDSTPYRPTGLALTDQAIGNLVEALEWAAVLVADLVREGTDLTGVESVDRELLESSSQGLRDVATLLRGGRVELALERFDEQQDASAARIDALRQDELCTEHKVHVAFHARIIGSAVRGAASSALVATGDSGRWTDMINWSAFRTVRRIAAGHASLRSVWFLNSLRGALALAAAVAVADLVHAQHGFWVVLGTLSVLRTNAASTGSTALRALIGTTAGFFIGGALILAIGHDVAALWVALPVAVLVASYSPGTAPFAIGQAAFTVTISVLYNILVPVGWRVGVIRIEDVAIGAAVSAVVGVVFWPRGASAVVANDLADAFHEGGIFLVQATAWAVGTRPAPPDEAVRVTNAGLRLDDALRGFVAEQGTKRVAKEHVWRLVGSTERIRLTSQSLANLPRPETGVDPARNVLVQEATRIAGWCDAVAGDLGRISSTAARELAISTTGDTVVARPKVGYLLWVLHHLDHIRQHLDELVESISIIAERRTRPWWR